MTLSTWIKKYCEDNNITLPDDIADDETALMIISLIKDN